MNWTIWAGLIGVCATGCWLCWPTIAGWFDPVERARHSPEPGVDRPFGIDAQPDYSAGGYAADKPASKIGPITARVPVQVVDRSGLLLLPRSLTGQLNTPDGNQHVADDDNTAWHARILIARLTDELSMQSATPIRQPR